MHKDIFVETVKWKNYSTLGNGMDLGEILCDFRKNNCDVLNVGKTTFWLEVINQHLEK